MSTIEVLVDTVWSDLGATLDDVIEIKVGSTLTIDVPAKIYQIHLVEGNLFFDCLDDISYTNPSLTFKDEPGSGIHITSGKIGVTDNSYKEYLFLVRVDINYTDDHFPRCKNKWALTFEETVDLKDDIVLINIDHFVLHDIRQGLWYTDEKTLFKTLDKSFSLKKYGSVSSFHTNDLDGGSSYWVDFDRVKSRRWSAEGAILRDYGGLHELNTLYDISRLSQRFRPVLLISKEKITYIAITSIQHDVGVNYLEYTFDFLEVDFEYEEY